MNRKDICKKVTDRIVSELKKGEIPWEKPWAFNGAWSRTTGKPYSFLNQLMLPQGEYATFKQIREEGGKVKKGAKAYTIVFYKWIENIQEKDGEEVVKRIPFLRYINVFNIEEQTDLEVKHEKESVRGASEVKDLEEIKRGYVDFSGVTYEEKESDRAFYSPLTDSVVVPLKEQFDESAEYYGTVFHELAHSTGTRLGREMKGKHEIGEYSREELVAELTSSSILANFGEETESSFKNNTAYIQSWIKVLNNDNEALVWACSRAEKAFNLITKLEMPKEAPKSPDTEKKAA